MVDYLLKWTSMFVKYLIVIRQCNWLVCNITPLLPEICLLTTSDIAGQMVNLVLKPMNLIFWTTCWKLLMKSVMMMPVITVFWLFQSFTDYDFMFWSMMIVTANRPVILFIGLVIGIVWCFCYYWSELSTCYFSSWMGILSCYSPTWEGLVMRIIWIKSIIFYANSTFSCVD